MGLMDMTVSEPLSLAFLKAGFVEFLSMILFLFFTIGTAANSCRLSGVGVFPNVGDGISDAAPIGCDLTGPRVTNIAFAFGVSIFVLVYAAASYSGGHLNPAVTVGLTLSGKCSIMRMVYYIPMQMAGATVGAGLVKAVDRAAFMAASGGTNLVGAGVSSGAAWGMEAILTFGLVYVVLAATDPERSLTTAHVPVLAPLAIGFEVFLAHLVAIPVDGCSINPARSFATAAIFDDWTDQWIFWVGPLSGGIFASLVYEIFLRHDSPMDAFKPAAALKREEMLVRDNHVAKKFDGDGEAPKGNVADVGPPVVALPTMPVDGREE